MTVCDYEMPDTHEITFQMSITVSRTVADVQIGGTRRSTQHARSVCLDAAPMPLCYLSQGRICATQCTLETARHVQTRKHCARPEATAPAARLSMSPRLQGQLSLTSIKAVGGGNDSCKADEK